MKVLLHSFHLTGHTLGFHPDLKVRATFYYMASSASGQDEPNRDWLAERARWSHLARSGLPAVSRKQN